MPSRPWTLLAVVAAGALALAACSRHSDVNANAPGSPGTGNGVAQVQPSAPDSPAAGSNGEKGSLPTTGPTGNAVPLGASGNGQARAQAPGVGLNGGLGTGNATVASSNPTTGSTTSAPMGAGPDSAAPGGNGSPNMTTRSSVGNR